MQVRTKGNLSYILWILVYVLIVGLARGWFSNNNQETKEEPISLAAQSEYTWFIGQAEQIAKVDKDLKISLGCIAKVDEQFSSYSDKQKRSPKIAMQYNQLTKQCTEELRTLASQRNSMVQEYNIASEKFNWSPFRNRQDKPMELIPGYVTF